MKKIIVAGVVTALFSPHAVAKTKQKVKTKIYHVCSPKDSVETALACALYQEARGDGLHGMWLVGNVILNRKEHSTYPNKIRRVIYQKGQFSYTKRKRVLIEDAVVWEKAKKTSKALILISKYTPRFRCFLDATKGSLFFYKRNIEPRWMKDNYDKKITYKGHVFYG